MSTHKHSELNALQAGLHQSVKPKCQLELQEWVAPHFSPDDHYITLTYRQYVKRDELERSADVKHFLNRLNRKVYGKAYEKRRARLKTYPVFEFNKSGGLHVHIVVSNPTDAILTKSIEQLAIEIWIEMKWGGQAKGQDVRSCYEVMGLIEYSGKGLQLNDKLLMLDVLNIYWPL